MRTNRNYICVLFFLVLSTPGIAKAVWETTYFEVFFGEPWYSSRTGLTDFGRLIDENIASLDESQPRPSYISQATVTELESYLHETAKFFESTGFKQPQLEPLVERKDGKKAYRVYLYDTGRSAPASYRNACQGGVIRQLIEVHVDSMTGDGVTIDGAGKITDKGYADLAHELFHAVQASYPIFTNDCDLGDWIVEGTAEALGQDTALKLRGIDPRNHASMGLRRYYKPLRVQDDPPCLETDAGGLGCLDKNDGYWTASLWRYIGEMSRKGGAFPPTSYTEPKYDYLNDYFSRTLPGRPSEKAELTWLDENLANPKGFNKSLNSVFSTFTTAFSAYPKTRPGTAGAMSDSKQTLLLKTVFDRCPVIHINPDETPILATVDLEKVAAACFRLTTDTGSPMHVQVTAHPYGKAQLHDLWAGVSGGMQVGPALVVKANNTEFAEWRFRVDLAPGENTTLVISNVAGDAENTNRQSLELRLTASVWNMSMGVQ